MNDSAGLHILMDARVADSSVFTREKLCQLFNQLTVALRMQPLGAVQVYEVPVDPRTLERVKETGVFEDEGGISTLLAITTSHLSLHAWPLQRYFALDTFSCKDFDAEAALAIIRDSIGVISENTLIVKRRKPSEDTTPTRVVRYFQV
jgi:S-adenosylmethionine/arginine decarboxylase-like enzyme